MMRRYTLLSMISLSLSSPVMSADGMAILEHQRLDAQQQQLQQEQESVRQAGFTEHREVRLPRELIERGYRPFPVERTCFPISSLHLTEFNPHLSPEAAYAALPSQTDFDWALKAVYAQEDFQLPYCVGEQGIEELIKRVQNAIIDRGFVTTRVLVRAQDLQSQRLVLTVVPGRVAQIILNDHSQPIKALRGTVWSALPIGQGDFLNIRDIEQGLENLRRPAHVEANIQIVPAQSSQI